MQGYLSGSLLTGDKLRPSGSLIYKSLLGTRQSSSRTDGPLVGLPVVRSDLKEFKDEPLNSGEVGVILQPVRTGRLRDNIMGQVDLNQPEVRGHRASLGRCRTGHAYSWHQEGCNSTKQVQPSVPQRDCKSSGALGGAARGHHMQEPPE